MNPSGYELNFTIPQGPTGPTGPADNFIRAFGQLYNQDQINSIFLPNNQSIQIALPSQSVELNVFHPFDNTIGFLRAGTYLVSYSILLQVPSATSGDDITVTSYLHMNQSTGEIAPVTITIENDLYYYFSNTTIINSQENDYIDLLINANKLFDWNYTSAFITVIKISDINN